MCVSRQNSDFNAVVEDTDFRTPRGLDRALFHKLTGCDWIRHSQHLVIGGPTGTGKSWLACARKPVRHAVEERPLFRPSADPRRRAQFLRRQLRARKRIGLDTATRMAEDADFGDNCEPAVRELEPRKIDPIEELKQSVSEEGTGLSPRQPKAPANSIRTETPPSAADSAKYQSLLIATQGGDSRSAQADHVRRCANGPTGSDQRVLV